MKLEEARHQNLTYFLWLGSGNNWADSEVDCKWPAPASHVLKALALSMLLDRDQFESVSILDVDAVSSQEML